MKTLATLIIGAALLATPAFAGNEADIVQQGGGINTIQAKQRGDSNDFASSQDGAVNRVALKQRGKKNKVGGFQNGPDNDFDLDQRD